MRVPRHALFTSNMPRQIRSRRRVRARFNEFFFGRAELSGQSK